MIQVKIGLTGSKIVELNSLAYNRVQKKTLENRYRVKLHDHSPIFRDQLIEKKIRPIVLIVLVLGRVEKMPKKRIKKL